LFESPIGRYPFVGWSARVSTEATPVERKYRLAVTLSDARRGAIAVSHSGKGQFTRGFSSLPRIPICIKHGRIGIRRHKTYGTSGRCISIFFRGGVNIGLVAQKLKTIFVKILYCTIENVRQFINLVPMSSESL